MHNALYIREVYLPSALFTRIDACKCILNHTMHVCIYIFCSRSMEISMVFLLLIAVATLLSSYSALRVNGQYSISYSNQIIENQVLQNVNGDVTFQNCTLQNVIIEVEHSNFTFENCTFTQHIRFYSSMHSNFTFEDCTFIQSQLISFYSSLVFYGTVTLQDTLALKNGGAMTLVSSEVTFMPSCNVTFYNNTALNGGALYMDYGSTLYFSTTSHACMVH